jgi:hypothetical protein
MVKLVDFVFDVAGRDSNQGDIALFLSTKKY